MIENEVIKTISFKNAAIEVKDDYVIAYLESKTGNVKTQFCLNDGVIEYYGDGYMSIYGHEVKWKEMWGPPSYWKENQEALKKICKGDKKWVIQKRHWILRTLFFLAGKKSPPEPIVYEIGKKSNGFLRLKAYEDFRLDLLQGANVILYRGITKKGE